MEEDYNVDDFVVSNEVDEVQEEKQDDNVQLSNEDDNGRTNEDNSESVSDESTVSGTEERTDNSIRGDSEGQTSTQSDSGEVKRVSEEDEKLLNSLRKLLSEENSDETGEASQDDLVEDELDDVPVEVEEQAIDYSVTLNSILEELEEVNSNFEALQTYLEESNDNNSMNSALSSQSATNVLLCVAIIVLLCDLVYHFGKGVL